MKHAQKASVNSEIAGRSGVRGLVTTAVFAAMVALATMVIQIPTPGTEGFVNVGDTIIFVGAALFGGQFGLLIGGVGSALADLLSGYGHWAPWTLIIKGIEGLVAGWLAHAALRRSGTGVQMVVGLAIAGLWMVVGYFLASWIIYGNVLVAGSGVPANLLQAAASIALALPLTHVLKKRIR